MHKSLPIIQLILAKISKSYPKNFSYPIKLKLLIKSLPNETVAIDQVFTN